MLLVNVLRRLGRLSTFMTVITAATLLWVSGVLPKFLTVLTAATVLWVSGVMSTCLTVLTAATVLWSRTIPMTKKSDASFALDRLLRHEGFRPEMIMDGSKEKNIVDFARKLRDAGCHRTQIETHSPWMNLCEGEVHELKRGLTRKMLKQNVPKKLWDHFLELESRIRSATTLPSFDLDHQTPEAKMHDMSADISDIC